MCHALLYGQASAESTKAHFDKYVLDQAEEKAAFDLVLEKTVAEGVQQKAVADKAMVDLNELQVWQTLNPDGCCQELAGRLSGTRVPCHSSFPIIALRPSSQWMTMSNCLYPLHWSRYRSQ